MNLYIYDYNNYYNRQFKKAGDLINDYAEFLHYGPVTGVYGFTPGDNVDTVQLIGNQIDMYDGGGNYLIVQNSSTNDIESRWFIMDATRTRSGQWQLNLHRDMVADFYEEVINSPMFIEKATLPSGSPLAFNSEMMTVNQIKTSETLLKDETKCPWFVGYYSDNVAQLDGTIPINEEVPGVITITTPIQNWEYYKYCSYNYGTAQQTFRGEIQSASYEVWFDSYSWKERDRGIRIEITDFDNEYYTVLKESNQGSSLKAEVEANHVAWALKRAARADNHALENQLKSTVFGKNLPINLNTDAEIKAFKQLNGITVVDSNGKKYKISMGTSSTEHISANITAGASFNTFKQWIKKANEVGWSDAYPGDVLKNEPNNDSFKAAANVTTYTLLLRDSTELDGTINYTIKSDKVITEDAPWNIFAIPYGKVTVKNPDGTVLIETDEEIGFRTASAMLRQHPVEIYDIQLLPYCPFEFIDDSDGSILLHNEKQYGTVKKDNDLLGIILNISRSRFTKTLTSYTQQGHTSSVERKLHNECDKWRLTAPNYSNYFDFSVEKNNGVFGFNIDCDYRPYSPYIHINPIFNGLYGYDDNSPRGLVCGGDYSLPGVVEQWQNYQLNNKNFQLIFDRQIQNMEVSNQIARKQEQFGAIAGTLTGGVSGAAAGAMMGGPYGAIAGAVAGTAASGIAGVADIRMNEQLREEALDYKKDLFGYQLGNIQALPNTISKISALNGNNKIFPLLEFYTCTDVEKEAFLKKIAWNGMSVGVIGTINDYIYNSWTYNGIESANYIKGQLIRFESEVYSEDFHLVNSLANELNKGIYFTERR